MYRLCIDSKAEIWNCCIFLHVQTNIIREEAQTPVPAINRVWLWQIQLPLSWTTGRLHDFFYCIYFSIDFLKQQILINVCTLNIHIFISYCYNYCSRIELLGMHANTSLSFLDQTSFWILFLIFVHFNQIVNSACAADTSDIIS